MNRQGRVVVRSASVVEVGSLGADSPEGVVEGHEDERMVGMVVVEDKAKLADAGEGEERVGGEGFADSTAGVVVERARAGVWLAVAVEDVD